MTPPLDLADLEAKARAATPGPWGKVGHPYYEYWIVEKHESDATGSRQVHPIAEVNSAPSQYEGGWYKNMQRAANAEFIVAANPSTILSLLQAHAEALAKIEELGKLVYVPGQWRCAKCNLVCQRMILNANTGATGLAANTKTEPCPNGCGPLWPVTERQAGNTLCDRLESALDEEKKLKAALADALAKVQAMEGNQRTEKL